MPTTPHPAPPPRTVRSRYGWATEDPARIGLDFDPATVPAADSVDHVNGLVDVVATCRAGESLLLWTKYRALAALHDQLTPGSGDADGRLVSEYQAVAARYAVTGTLGQATAVRHVGEAVAMVHRLPKVGERLRTGVIQPWQFSQIVTRSDLIDGRGYRHAVDAELAARLTRGSWSARKLNALVDSVIFAHDPDAVRDRHRDARESRDATVDALADGMAELRVTASVEDTRTAMAAITQLVTQVCCKNDPRRRGARRSDAVIARLHGIRFECECADPDTCTGQPDTADISERHIVIAMTVITEQATLTAEPGSSADGVGYIDGHGVITGDQVRDIAARPDTVIKPFPTKPAGQQPDPASLPDAGGGTEPTLDFDIESEPEPAADARAESTPGPEPADKTSPESQTTPENDPSAHTKPGQAPESESEPHTDAPACFGKPVLPLPCLPSDPYRFSAVFDTYIRVRDLCCSVPGCDRSAWNCQLDHCTEYHHDNPAAGGRTEAANVHPLCLFHHLLKTGEHGWLDDLTLDDEGRAVYWIRTPEGVWVQGSTFSGIDLFQSLKNVRFADPPAPAGPPPKRRTRSARTVDKHRRRQRERDQNRAAREAAERDAQRARDNAEIDRFWAHMFSRITALTRSARTPTSRPSAGPDDPPF